MMSLWDALRMNMMISYQELVRTFLNPQQATKLSNDFNALVRAASQYNSVREKVADPTRLGIDSMYQFKSIKLCADIQKTLIDSLVQRGESKQP
ncbi:Uncharacterised protein [Klebsiella pneumoniae]|nr:Uncharacterised protein [Klebsiella pneumoniae]